MRTVGILRQNHQYHIAGKGSNSPHHYDLLHKFIPVPQAMKTPAAKAAVEKEWIKLENSGVESDRSQKQNRGDR